MIEKGFGPLGFGFERTFIFWLWFFKKMMEPQVWF
jgi:hypothetical protein